MRYVIWFVALWFGTLTGARAGEGAEDPTLWSPPKARPAAKPIPSDSPELKACLATAHKRAEELAKEFESYPKRGLMVFNIEQGSPAEKLGLRIHDVLLKFDEAEVKDDLNSLRKPIPQKLTFYRYGSPEQTVEAPPGRLGVECRSFDLPKFPEFVTVPGNSRWNASIEAFKEVFSVDPELAEIELRRALAKGLPSSAQTDGWFAELALSQGEFARAMDFAWLALAKGAKERRIYDTFLSAAASACKLEAYRDMRAKRPPSDEDVEVTDALDRLVKARAALPVSQRAFKCPLDEAQTRWKDDILLRAARIPPNSGTDGQLDNLASRGEIGLSARGDHFEYVEFGPAAKDMLVTCRFKIRPADSGLAAITRNFRLQFGAYEKDKDAEAEFLVSICEFETDAEAPRSQLQLTIPNFSSNSNPERIHELRMAVLDGHAECVLDGMRVFYTILPVPTAAYVPCAFTCGMNADVRSMQVNALLSEADYRAAVAKDGVNALFREGQTRLHRAATAGRLAEARILLELGADPKLADKYGHTPLHLAAQAGDREILKSLLAKGGMVDDVVAGALGDREALAKLKAERGSKKNSSWTALHGAAAAGQVALIKELIAQGASVNAETEGRKETPLMWAARVGQRAACEALLTSKADPSRQDESRRTAAEYARWSGFPDLGALLESAKATGLKKNEL